MLAASLLAFLTGFLSLSQEILWVRIFSFANHSLPQAFACVLMLYLIGIALGAYIGKKICVRFTHLWQISGGILILSSFFDFVSPWVYAESVLNTSWEVAVAGVLITLTALLKSILFPIAHHLGASLVKTQRGRAISKIYVANIAGATLGPIVTGIILLGFLTTQQCYALTALLTCATGLYCLTSSPFLFRYSIASAGFAVILFGFIMTRAPSLLITRLADFPNEPIHVVETRQGIITIYHRKGGDMVMGGNLYDGLTNLDPVLNSNGIDRVLVLSTLKDNPEHVLMIGLSIGTWLKLVTSFPNIKNIDVVEINPGYLTAIKNYPRQQSALKDPRVRVHIDDARRWLKMHPNQQYDLIIMNTTQHWRMYACHMLSQEFLTLIKQHMKKNAVLSYNSTWSADTFKTAAGIFSYVYLYKNFVIAADFDWRKKLSSPAAVKKLSLLILDGKKLFPPNQAIALQKISHTRIMSLEQAKIIIKRRIEVVTDENLLTEYKYGARL